MLSSDSSNSKVDASELMVPFQSECLKAEIHAGLDVSQMGLRDLRTKIAIIPQDPVLFSGTVRSNLDPFDEHEDKDIWNAAQRVHLSEYIQSLPKKLESEVQDSKRLFFVKHILTLLQMETI